jgi:hypothetical protein
VKCFWVWVEQASAWACYTHIQRGFFISTVMACAEPLREYYSIGYTISTTLLLINLIPPLYL